MSQDYQDRRLDFENLLTINTINSTAFQEYFLKYADNALDFKKFKVYFNIFIAALDIMFDYKIEDLLEFLNNKSLVDNFSIVKYKGEDVRKNTLSDYILEIIVDAINKLSNDKLKNYLSNNLNISDANYTGSFKNSFITLIQYNKEIEKILDDNNNSSISSIDKNIINKLLLSPLFYLYSYILNIENIKNTNSNSNLEVESNFLVINFIIMYLIKYYFLSELLLKTLLDTKENIDGPLTNNLTYNLKDLESFQPIYNYIRKNDDNISFFTNLINGQLINKDFKYDQGIYDNIFSQMIIGNSIKNSQDSYNLDNMTELVYNLIKEIISINELIKINRDLYFSNNINYIIDPSESNRVKINKINNLNNHIKNVNKNINKLNLKNLNIQKEYEINRNLYIILVIFIVGYILLNVYSIVYASTEAVLYINSLIVVVIILTKFYKLIVKSYKTLIKDLNN